jgi:hypothetical protein
MMGVCGDIISSVHQLDMQQIAVVVVVGWQPVMAAGDGLIASWPASNGDR